MMSGISIISISFILDTGKVYKLFFKNGNTYITSFYEPLSTSEVIWTLKQHVS